MRRLFAACLLTVAAALVAVPAVAANDPLLPQQWGLDKIGAQKAWSVARGDGVVIAVVDSGVDLNHVDLKAKLVPGANFVEPGRPPQDDCGHGTHVAGIAAAATDNGVGVAGVAPGARIMPVRVLGSDGSGGCGGSDVSAGIRWAADHGARVINMSLGSDTEAVFGPSFSDAIRYAWSKGAICVVAAGNQFVLSSGFADEPAIVVAATDRNDAKPLYSSGVGSAQWGMSAPGGAGNVIGPSTSAVDILSTYFDPSRPDDHSEYATLAGTSMATPFVSGAAAVLLSMGLTKEQVVQRLLSTADNVGSSSTFGHGRLNLDRAVHSAEPAPSPSSIHRTSGAGAAATAVPTSSAGRVPNAGRTTTSPPTARAAVTPQASASVSGPYAAPQEPPSHRSGAPLRATAAAVVGVAAALAGGWALYRLAHRSH